MSPSLPYDPARLALLARQIVVAGGEFAACGWTPATSGNFSARLDAQHVAITVSGRDKGRLAEDDIMVVDLEGHCVAGDRKTSAETLLHTRLYRRSSQIGCVLHTHSLAQTLTSRLYSNDGRVRLQGYELLKAFSGITTHDTELVLPVFTNTQDMQVLADQVDAWLDREFAWGYLIGGHGLYAWGSDLAQAQRHLEAFEFLLNCELELRKLTRRLPT